MSFRVAAVCFACAPGRGSEPKMSWNWLTSLRDEGCEISAFTQPKYRSDFGADEEGSIVHEGIEVNFVSLPPPARISLPHRLDLWRDYVGWQQNMLAAAERRHALNPFDVAHHLSFASATQGVVIDRLGVPTVLGPVGGAQFPPTALRGEFPATWRAEVARRGAVEVSLRNPWRRRQLREMSSILASNRETADALRSMGADVELMLDDGATEAAIRRLPRQRQPGPIRLAWIGRIYEIKALGLALDAVQRAAESIDLVLEICGDGPDLERHRSQLGSLERRGLVQYRGWVEPEQLAEVYEGTAAILYTSLRDNGGEPLHRAAEQGIPCIVLDHQGPGSIVSEASGIRVPVTNRGEIVSGLAAAIETLAGDRRLYHSLSLGALARARQNTWSARAQRVTGIYEEISRI